MDMGPSEIEEIEEVEAVVSLPEANNDAVFAMESSSEDVEELADIVTEDPLFAEEPVAIATDELATDQQEHTAAFEEVVHNFDVASVEHEQPVIHAEPDFDVNHFEEEAPD